MVIWDPAFESAFQAYSSFFCHREPLEGGTHTGTLNSVMTEIYLQIL